MAFGVNGSERMRINSSGNVGIGTTESSVPLNVVSAYSSGAVTTSLKLATVGGYDSGSGTALEFGQDQGIYSNWVSGKISSPRTGNNYGGSLVFSTNRNSSATDVSEAMRIDSSGTFILGKTTDDFNTAGFHVVSGGSVYSGIQTQSASSSYHLRDTTNNTWEFYVTGAGQIHATSTSITSLSDERLKENIKDLETGLTEVMSLKPRRFDWKDREQKNIAGFIAQEVETVLPDLVSDFMHDDLEDAKSVKMGDMIPTLVKAIQEQQAIIDDLKSRIETLEG